MDTRPITNQEYTAYASFCLKHGIDLDGEVGQKNGIAFGNFLQSRNQRITEANLQAALEAIKTQVVFVNAVKAEYNRVVANFSDYDRDFIAAKLASYGYETSNEQDLLHNWTLVAKEFLRRGYQVTNEFFKIVIGNLAAGPSGDLLRKKAQPSKFNAAKAVEEQKNAPKVERDPSKLTYIAGEHPDSWYRPLSGPLKDHRDQVHAAMEAAAKKKEAPQPQQTESSYWKSQVEQYLSSIRENNTREYLQQEFSKPKNGNWQFTWRVLDNTYNRIKNQGLATYLAEQAEKV